MRVRACEQLLLGTFFTPPVHNLSDENEEEDDDGDGGAFVPTVPRVGDRSGGGKGKIGRRDANRESLITAAHVLRPARALSSADLLVGERALAELDKLADVTKEVLLKSGRYARMDGRTGSWMHARAPQSALSAMCTNACMQRAGLLWTGKGTASHLLRFKCSLVCFASFFFFFARLHVCFPSFLCMPRHRDQHFADRQAGQGARPAAR